MILFDHYHDLAAQLLGRDSFPLPLPNMDRNYPHNIGLLSDAEESALAAAVLQLTNGMSYESWKTLDMDQRVPWMEQAVKRAGADNRSNGVTRAEVIAELVDRVQAGMNVVTADDVANWPNGLLKQFVVDGILTPAANAKSIACDACGDDHVEPVQFVEAPPGAPLRAYITCPENGRVHVPMERLRCWQVKMNATPNAKDNEDGAPEFKLPDNVTVQVTHSTEFLPTPPANDPKGLRDAAEYCRAQAAKLGDARAKWWWVQAQVYDQQADTAESQPSPSTHRVSHTLAVAHRSLIEAIGPALELYKRTLRFSNPTPVLSAIERFVHELRLVPEWHQELQQRSTMVEVCCQAGSKFDVLRHKALSTHTNIPTKLSGAKLALERLHSDGTRTPQFLQEVATVRNSVERLLQEPPDDMSDAAIAAFKEWRDECRAIQLQAERVHVDGCWYLDQVYQASESDPTERSQAARAILQTDMGGGQLEEVHAAVESMFAWANENPAAPIQRDEPAAAQHGPIAREWPSPEEHTIGKLWTRKDGALCFSTKTDGESDGVAEFALTSSGELTFQMRFMMCVGFTFPDAVTLADIIEQVYPDDFAIMMSDPDVLKKTLRKLRSLVSDVRTKKFAKAGLNPDILPPLSVEASLSAGIQLRLAHLHRLDDKELDQADAAPA